DGTGGGSGVGGDFLPGGAGRSPGGLAFSAARAACNGAGNRRSSVPPPRAAARLSPIEHGVQLSNGGSKGMAAVAAARPLVTFGRICNIEGGVVRADAARHAARVAARSLEQGRAAVRKSR